MAKCALMGKKPSFGNNVSHANNRTRRTWRPNVHKHRVYIPELRRFVTLSLSAKALRTISKKGLLHALADAGITLKDLRQGEHL